MNLSQFNINNLTINKDEIAILDYLVDYKLLPSKISGPFSVINYPCEDLALILHLPEAEDSKFLMFYFFDFARHSAIVAYLISVLHELAEENYFTFKPAEKKLQEAYFMIPTYRALFGYKAEEEMKQYL